MQFTIEQRQLTSEDSHRPAFEPESTTSIVEAADHDEAIGRFADTDRSEIVSIVRPLRGREAVATVRRNETIFLWRIAPAAVMDDRVTS
jgi:hypothetical protein